MNWFSDVAFWAFALLTVIPAMAILVSRRIVHMAFWLLASLAGVAGLYLQLGAGFLGFAQVVVYIGGILILFLFGLMLTQKRDVPVREKFGVALVFPGVLAGVAVMVAFLFVAIAMPWQERSPPPMEYSAPQIGLELMSTYILPFEAVSVLLVAAMVGAAYIVRRRDDEVESPAPAEGKDH